MLSGLFATIRSKILSSTIAIGFLAIFSVSGFGLWFSAQIVRENSIARMQLTLADAAADVESVLKLMIASVRTLEKSVGVLGSNWVKDRELFDAMLKALLEQEDAFVGVWTGWEPNAYDDNDSDFVNAPGHDATGRYVPYWYRDGGKIDVTALVDYDTPGAGDYYLQPLQTQSEVLFDPFLYPVGDVDVLMTTFAIPTFEKGKAVGVVGVDVDLKIFQDMITSIRPYEVGRVALVSPGGVVSAWHDASKNGKDLSTLGVPDAIVQAVAQGGTVVDEVTIEGVEMEIATSPVVSGVGKPWSVVAFIPLEAVEAPVKDLALNFLAVGAAVLFVAVLVAVWIGRMIATPIQKMSAVMKVLAGGDASVAVPYDRAGGEVGAMAQAVAVFRDGLRDRARLEAEAAERDAAQQREKQAMMNDLAQSFEQEVQGISSALVRASEQMQDTAQVMQTVAARADDGASAAGTESQGASENVSTVATATEQLSSSITEISTQVSNATDISAEAVTIARQADGEVAGLIAAAEKIGAVVSLISDIAEQTNLLALNATIEAARAGEAGKGFAVVASEVKSLANQTAKATEDISRQIEDIQNATTTAAGSIAKVSETIEQINGITVSVSAAVEEQTAATSEISRSAQQASAATTSVHSNLSAVRTGVSETGEKAGEVYEAATSLTTQSADLSKKVADFIRQIRQG